MILQSIGGGVFSLKCFAWHGFGCQVLAISLCYSGTMNKNNQIMEIPLFLFVGSMTGFWQRNVAMINEVQHCLPIHRLLREQQAKRKHLQNPLQGDSYMIDEYGLSEICFSE